MPTPISKILITGARGQLARALAHAAPAATEIVALERAHLDICDAAAVKAALETHRPEVVFNGAAYNLVDKAEGDGARTALEINALGPAVLAAACRDMGAKLVHFSTDFVFDGQKKSPYLEADPAQPQGVYGASKLCGENVVLAASPRHLVIRVCRLFGPIDGETQKPGGNFPLLMIKLGKERESVRVVDDQIGSPSYTPDLARGVWQLLENGASGLFHLSNAGEVSFADYAREIFQIAGVSCAVEAVSTADYGAPAARPLYSTLDNAKAHHNGVAPLRHWREALQEFLQEKA
ncbi:dTDP-4-dehydrorhamnose reductase [Abditibacterium utsteinense]|uniref:dTDP-4-dehydrorhamnose reductase n=1 Tax=Abditibacterium utsteinense TaxID=1960156 RepID=A0A2S8ST66_9BACT|nr:dTDP-4-dehydrorhamnose reductase [Abditibacterium utsteinense]PQV63992.1 dTDP-4-dehydrorhamnose reductase [Abditibacterium utsteinense]